MRTEPPAGDFVYWSPGSGTPPAGGAGGSGSWDTTTSNWTIEAGGSRGVWPNAGQTAYFSSGSGTVTVSGSNNVVFGGMEITGGNYTFTGGNLKMNGGGATIYVDSGKTAELNLSVSDNTQSARLTKTGSGTLILSGSNTYNGGTDIQQGTLQLGSNSTNGTVRGAVSGGGTLSILASSNIEFGNNINSFSGNVEIGSIAAHIVVTLTADNSSYSGTTSSYGPAPTINVVGKLGGDVVIQSNSYATLSGTGTVGSPGRTVTIFGPDQPGANGLISPGDYRYGNDYTAIGTLTIAGNLSLVTPQSAPGKDLAPITLLQTGDSSANSDLIVVNGNLAISGALIVDFFGTRYGNDNPYVLFTYGGSEVGEYSYIEILDENDNSRHLGDNEYSIDYHYNGNSVVLYVYKGFSDQDFYWNGGTGGNAPQANGAGGNGTWQSASSTGTKNWSNQSGSQTSAWVNGKTAHFATSAGTVTVGGSDISAAGLVFEISGYVITGNGITLSGPSPTIDVGGNDALVDVTITSSGLTKTGSGTLTLSQANQITGTLTISAGMLQLGGGATWQNGSVQSAINGSGTLQLYALGDISFGNDINNLLGDFQLRSTDTSIITLTGSNGSYNGTTTNAGGTVVMNVMGSHGGSIFINGNTTLAGTGTAGGNVTIGQNGNVGNLKPGDYTAGENATGTLTIGNNLTLAGGALTTLQIGDGPSDLVVVQGWLTLGGTLAVYFSGQNFDTPYTLFTYGSYSGSFGSEQVWQNGTQLSQSDYRIIPNYNGNNEVVLVLLGALTDQDFYWNGGTGSNSPQPNGAGGSGTWASETETTYTNWTGQSGEKLSAWVNGKTAHFATGGGTVTVGDWGISAAGLSFDEGNRGYKIVGRSITLTGSSPVIYVDPGDHLFLIEQAEIASFIISENGFTVSGGGYLFLYADNTESGDITLTDGSYLFLGNTGESNAFVSGSISGDGSLVVYVAENRYFDNDITGLLGDFNIYSSVGDYVELEIDDNTNARFFGKTTVSFLQGGLVLNGSLGGDVYIQSGLLAGEATIGGSVTMYGDSYNVATVKPTGTMTIAGGMQFAYNSELYMDVGDSDSDLINIAGAADLYGGVFYIYFSGENYGDPYTLITYGSSSGAQFWDDYVYDMNDGGRTLSSSEYHLDYNYNNTNSVVLIVYGALPGQEYYWNGGTGGNAATAYGMGGNGTWSSSAGTRNWTDDTGSNISGWSNGKTANFYRNPGTVTVSGSGITAASLVFNVGGYLLTGDGIALSGTLPAIHADTGTTTLDVAITSTNLALPGAGTVVLTRSNAITGTVTVEGGTLQLGAAGYGTGSFSAAISGSGLLGIYASSNYAFANSFSGFSGDLHLASSGSSIITISGTNGGYQGATTNVGGTPILNVSGNLGGTVTIDGGMTLAGNGTVGSADTTVVIGATSTSYLKPGDYRLGETATGTLTIGGGLTLNPTSSGIGASTRLQIADTNTDLVVVGGALGLGGYLRVDFSGTKFGPYNPYVLFSYDSYTGDFDKEEVYDVANGNALMTSDEYKIILDYQNTNQVVLIVYGQIADQDFYWNGDDGANLPVANGVGGDGSWKDASATSTKNWSDKAGQMISAWVNGKTANFDTLAGNVTVDGTSISAAGLNFNVDGYILTGNAITLSGAAPAVSVASGDATLDIVVTATGLTKTGTGTLILTQTNPVSGTIAISGGTLQLGAYGYGNGSVTGAITGSGLLRIYATADQVFANDMTGLTGNFELASDAASMISVTGANGTYAGTTSNVGGTPILNVMGALGGTISVDAGMTLAGTGTVGSAGTMVTVAAVSAGSIKPGDYRNGETATGTLTIGGDLTLTTSATIGEGSTLWLQIGDTNSDLLNVTGALALGGLIRVDFSGTQYGPDNPYLLVNYGSYTGDFGSKMVVEGGRTLTPDEYEILVGYNNTNTIVLIVYGTIADQDYYWNGLTGANQPTPYGAGGDGSWRDASASDTRNWTNEEGSQLSPWVDGKTAVFDTLAGTVTVEGTQIQASGLYFNVDGYLLTGNGISLTGTSAVIDVSAGGAAYQAILDIVLTGSGFTKSGGGTLVLTEANLITGTVTMNGGTLQLGDSVRGNGSVGGPIAGYGDLVLYAAANLTFDNDITGLNGSFAIEGPSDVLIANTVNATFAGPTDFLGTGTLNVTGSLGGALRLQSGTLAGNGVLGGTVTAYSGSTIAPTGVLSIGGDLVFQSGSGLIMMVGGANADLIDVTGALNASGNLTVSLANGSTSGVYPLINATSVSSTFTVLSKPNGSTVEYLPNQVRLVVTDANGQVGLYWNGQISQNSGLVGGDGTWNTSNMNWTDSTGSWASRTSWVNDGTGLAIFAGTTAGNVQLVSGIQASGLDFRTAGYRLYGADFVLTGVSGTATINVSATTATIDTGMTGSVAVNKTGTGTLVLSAINGFTGGVTISGGTLQIGDSTYGAGDVLGPISGSGTLDYYAPALPASGIEFDNDITGLTGNFNVIGPGIVNFTGNNVAYAKTTTVSKGTLNLLDYGIGGTVNVSGGTLSGNGATIGAGNTTVSIGLTTASILSPGDASDPAQYKYGGLTILGNLTLGANATTKLELAQRNLKNDPTANDVVTVNSALSIAGSLNVVIDSDRYGLYYLIGYGSYSGQFGATSVTFNGTVLTSDQYEICYDASGACSGVGEAGYVTLDIVNAPAGQDLYWNGGTTIGTGAPVGGNGTWYDESFYAADETNPAFQYWTDATNTAIYPWTDERNAVFMGQAGTVQVNDTGAPILLGGLEFRVDGYVLQSATSLNAALTISSAFNPLNVNVINAGDTATIALDLKPEAALNGMGSVSKNGAGTVSFAHDMSYGGSTEIEDGTLQLGTALLGGLSGSVKGDVQIGQLAIFWLYDVTGDALGNTITGEGQVLMNRAGYTISYTGNSQAFAGDLYIAAGTLTLQTNATAPTLSAASLHLGPEQSADQATSDGGALLLSGSGALLQVTQEAFIGYGNGGSYAAALKVEAGATFSATGETDIVFAAEPGTAADALVTGSQSILRADNGDIQIGLSDTSTVSMEIADSGIVRTGGGNILIGEGNNTTVTVTVHDGGLLDAPQGQIVMGQANGSGGATSTLSIGGAVGSTPLDPGQLSGTQLLFGGGTPLLSFNHKAVASDAYTMSIDMASVKDTAAISHRSGFTTYTGNGSGFIGKTTIVGGTLNVNGTLGGLFDVQAGGTLSGIGTISSATGTVQVGIGSGSTNFAVLSPGDGISAAALAGNPSYGTLTVLGDLLLSTESKSIFEMSVANYPAGGPDNDLVAVGATLTLGGALEVDVLSAPSSTGDKYILFTSPNNITTDYARADVTVTAAGVNTGRFETGTQQNPSTLLFEYFIELYQTPINTALYWNGSVLQPNNQVNGGTGTWIVNAQQTNWTDQNGTLSFDWASPNTAIFTAQAGTVSVDGSGSPPIQVTGLIFDVDGYVLTYTTSAAADSLELVFDQNGATPVIEVDTGTAQIGVVLTGADGMEKTGNGTLVLVADNTYDDDTLISAGTLQLGSTASALNGSIAGDIVFGNNVGLILAIETVGASTFANNVSGPSQVGDINMRGSGTLTFSGDTTGFDGDAWVYEDAIVNLTGTLVSDKLQIGLDKAGLNPGTSALVVTGSGRGNIGTPTTGAAVLTTSGSGTAALAFGALSANAAAQSGFLQLASIVFESTGTSLVFNHTATDLTLFNLGAQISSANTGQGTILQQAGFTHYSGDADGFLGITSITGGTLDLAAGHLGGQTTVYGGTSLTDPNYGTLSGEGVLQNATGTALTVKAYGTLENAFGKTLTVNGTASLENESRLIVHLESDQLNAPRPHPLFDITTITTDPTTVIYLDVRPVGGDVLANGSYLLIEYSRWTNANNNQFSIIQAGLGYSIDVRTSSRLVYLDVNSTIVPRPYWNPSQATTPASFGGNGTWSMLGADLSWSDDTGANNGGWTQGATPIFSGQSSTVKVDVSSGAITVGGFDFQANTTLIVTTPGVDTLALSSNSSFATATVASGVTATVDLPLTGSAGLLKAGAGTLELTGMNTFTGGASVLEGILELTDSATTGAIGSLAGSVSIEPGATFAVDTAGTAVFNAANQILGGDLLATNNPNAPASDYPHFHIVKGTVTLNSDSIRFEGITTVDGTLQGQGKLGGDTTVNGTLFGTVSNPTPLTLENLTLAAAGTLSVELNTTPNSTPLIKVSTFTPEGADVLITVAGGGDPNTALRDGDYFLIEMPTVPTGDPNLTLDPSITNPNYELVYLMKGLYLYVDDGLPDLYWNPFQRTAPSSLGGAGTWTADVNNKDWSDQTGANNGPWQDGAIGYFTGTAATVNVASPASGPSTEQIRFAGLVFTVDGYTLTDNGNSDILTIAGANANVDVEGTATATIALPVAGSGQLTKTNTGTVILTAQNTYQGGTNVSDGVLQVGQAGNIFSAGNINIGSSGNFSWASDVDYTLSGKISGGGLFSKDKSASKLFLTGDSSGFAGQTAINAGTLSLTGALGGKITVGGGAYVTGTGTFGDVTLAKNATFIVGDGASVTSASPVNTLTADSDSTISVTADFALGQASVIVSDGDVTLQQNVIVTFAHQVGVQQGDNVTIIKSTNGQINEAAAPSIAAGGGALVYDSIVKNNNELVVFVASTLLEARCGDFALSVNSCGTMEAVQTLPPATPLYESVQAAGRDELDDALSSLSGDAYASMSGAMVANSHYLRDATGRHVRGTLGGIAGGETISAVSNYAAETPVLTPFGAFVEENSGIGVWATGYGSWSRIKGEGGSATITDSAGGFYLGADFAAFDTMRFGAVVGYGQSSYEVDARNVTGRSDDFTLGFYGGGQWGGFGSDFGMAYTWHDVTADREIDFSTLSERERGTYDAGTFQVYGDLGYTFAITDSFQIEPYVDASYIHQQSGSFTEAGGVAALFHPESEMDTWFTTVGVRSAWEFRLGEYQSRLTAAAGWRAGFGDLNPAEQVAFDGGDVFGITGAPLAKNQGIVSVGFETQFTDKVSVGLNYTGQFGGGNESQNVSARLNIRF
ncbi:autotransporter-associated beta strand repeat-containing protein [Martelella limonii]|uniref:autotransporter-associated beta strand repeat-containing protein n=1 Tax=Martelella limonii TaxID=1647649 RepID=UPI001580859C